MKYKQSDIWLRTAVVAAAALTAAFPARAQDAAPEFVVSGEAVPAY